MTCLFAVTTDLPARSARRIQSSAGDRPPINSTSTSTSSPSASSMFSVQRTEGSTQSTRFAIDAAIDDDGELQIGRAPVPAAAAPPIGRPCRIRQWRHGPAGERRSPSCPHRRPHRRRPPVRDAEKAVVKTRHCRRELFRVDDKRQRAAARRPGDQMNRQLGAAPAPLRPPDADPRQAVADDGHGRKAGRHAYVCDF